jgi:hypothetical protein
MGLHWEDENVKTVHTFNNNNNNNSSSSSKAVDQSRMLSSTSQQRKMSRRYIDEVLDQAIVDHQRSEAFEEVYEDVLRDFSSKVLRDLFVAN